MPAARDNGRLRSPGKQASNALRTWMRSMRKMLAMAAFVGSAFWLALGASAEGIDLGERRIGGALARADWTIDKAFPGEKLMFEAQHAFRRRAMESPGPSVRDERLSGVLRAELQWGKGETGLERYDVYIAPVIRQRIYRIEPGSLQPARDFREFGAVRFDSDDPLGLDSYAEISIARLGRAWQKRASSRPITFTIDLQVSAGWAWARSFDERYANVSNPYTGMWSTLAFEHDKWGQVYMADRLITGTSLGSPKDSMSREARIRLGYVKRIGGCFHFEAFLEKRSFNFSDEVLPSLYTKGKRYGVQVDCRSAAN